MDFNRIERTRQQNKSDKKMKEIVAELDMSNLTIPEITENK